MTLNAGAYEILMNLFEKDGIFEEKYSINCSVLQITPEHMKFL